MLEHLGVRVDEERPYRIETAPGAARHGYTTSVWNLPTTWEFDIDRVKELFENAFASVWCGEVENDGFNRLVLRAQLGAREVTILRAYAKYLRQIGSTFSDAYIERALTGNPAIARKLPGTVPGTLQPRPRRRRRAWLGERPATRFATRSPNMCSTRSKLRSITCLTSTKTAFLRQFLGVINATVRTNYFRKDSDEELDPICP